MSLFNFPELPEIDYKAHNEEVSDVWKNYATENHIRMPMILGINPRVLLCDPKINKKRISFKDYTNNPDLMAEVQCELSYYIRHYVLQDGYMGLPENWNIYVDFQNYFEAGWFGCEIIYRDWNVPASIPMLHDDNKEKLFYEGIPDPFSNLMAKNKSIFEHMKNKEYVFYDRKVTYVSPAAMYTDGPMTIACNLRGTTEFCIDLYEDPDYAIKLLDFITEATIARLKAWRTYLGQPLKTEGFGFADDSTALLSINDYKRFIMPFHKRLIHELSEEKQPNSIHLCGDATHLFETLKNELNIMSFDTGYPVKHGDLIKSLGQNVSINGGPAVSILQFGKSEDVEKETLRIINEVKPLTKRFIMREANNLSPCTPLENIEAMYKTVQMFG